MSTQKHVTITVPVEEIEPTRPLIFRILDWLNYSNEVKLYLMSVAGSLMAATLCLVGYFDWDNPPEIPGWIGLVARVFGPMAALVSIITILFAAGRASAQEAQIADLKRQLAARSPAPDD